MSAIWYLTLHQIKSKYQILVFLTIWLPKDSDQFPCSNPFNGILIAPNTIIATRVLSNLLFLLSQIMKCSILKTPIKDILTPKVILKRNLFHSLQELLSTTRISHQLV